MRTLKKLREYRNGDIAEWLKTEFRQIVRTLDLVLVSLKFTENFGGFEWEGEIPAGQSVEIRNRLYPVIPSRRIVLRSQQGRIADGPAWTRDSVFLENLAASDDTVKVVFLP